MSLKGNLKEMTVADLIQHTCQDQKTALLFIRSDGEEASLYFHNGAVVHATMDQEEGENVVYSVLDWDEGEFELNINVPSPAETIKRSWASLLLEGARRIDESTTDIFNSTEDQNLDMEVQTMGKLDDLLAEMGTEITGYVASAVVGMDGINIASHTVSDADPDVISAQMTKLFKLVDSTVKKMDGGELEDNLITMERAYILMRFLPGGEYYLGMAADRNSGRLGNMRLISKIYSQKIAKAMPK